MCFAVCRVVCGPANACSTNVLEEYTRACVNSEKFRESMISWKPSQKL